MRSLRPCSDSSATPSFPSQPEGKIGLYAATAAAAAKSLQSCPTPCDPIDSSPPGSPVPGILQARTLEWVTTSFYNACMHAKSLQSCPTPCDPIDGISPGSPIPGILQAPGEQSRVLSPNGRGGWTPLRPLRGLQETRVATREESGVHCFPSRRGLMLFP